MPAKVIFISYTANFILLSFGNFIFLSTFAFLVAFY